MVRGHEGRSAAHEGACGDRHDGKDELERAHDVGVAASSHRRKVRRRPIDAGPGPPYDEVS
jgi:hypothetical protein